MPEISYAGNHEDILLKRVFKDISEGFFIDVGAAHPTNGSVTKLLYDKGWSGLNIEPLPHFIDLLNRDRPRDINVACAVGATDGGEVELFYGASAYGASFDGDGVKSRASEHTQIATVVAPIRSVNSLWKELASQRTVDLLKIDVEGMELPALQGCDLKAMSPTVIMVEATQPYSSVQSHHDWEPLILACGYACALFDGVNRYYAKPYNATVLAELSIPANVLDDFIPIALADARAEVEQLKRSLGEPTASKPSLWSRKGK